MFFRFGKTCIVAANNFSATRLQKKIENNLLGVTFYSSKIVCWGCLGIFVPITQNQTYSCIVPFFSTFNDYEKQQMRIE